MQGDQVLVYSLGIVACSVCAPTDMPPAMVVAEVNMQEPTGISSDWTLDEAPAFHTGQPNPSPCDKHPEVRTHYLLKC
jgi:hypothetical protein